MVASTTRWLGPLTSKPTDYPEELPFLPDRGCLLSRSGAGESQLFSVMWPASTAWPADLLRKAHDSPAYPTSAEQAVVYVAARSSPLPEEVATAFDLIREMSRTAGWVDPRYHWPGITVTEVQFWKGPRLRLIIATSAGVTLQEGQPEREAAGV